MTDVLVQIRTPKKLVDDFRSLPSSEHFMDLSEHIREVVREEWMKQTKPDLFQLKQLREDILSELKKQTQANIKKELIEELNAIKKQIKKE